MTEKKQHQTGILIKNVKRARVVGNVTSGYENGIEVSDADGLEFHGNSAHAPAPRKQTPWHERWDGKLTLAVVGSVIAGLIVAFVAYRYFR